MRKKGKTMKIFITAIYCIFASTATYASVIYSYVGNNYDTFDVGSIYDSSMSISGSFILPGALAPNFSGPVVPVSYTFTDGIFTYTELNSTLNIRYLVMNASGEITQWLILSQLSTITPEGTRPNYFELWISSFGGWPSSTALWTIAPYSIFNRL